MRQPTKKEQILINLYRDGINVLEFFTELAGSPELDVNTQLEMSKLYLDVFSRLSNERFHLLLMEFNDRARALVMSGKISVEELSKFYGFSIKRSYEKYIEISRTKVKSILMDLQYYEILDWEGIVELTESIGKDFVPVEPEEEVDPEYYTDEEYPEEEPEELP